MPQIAVALGHLFSLCPFLVPKVTQTRWENQKNPQQTFQLGEVL
ncbi:MAG: hypothetical protein Ct9H300mP32_6490 [Verrucomicrobiota bacterium]|nr:MAG: hypothetical protein Ct9H300mP32_6490 [Verrucomicrobiota bacterium]